MFRANGRGVKTIMRISLVVVCVLAAAAPALAALSVPSLGGRWQGPNYRMAAKSPECNNGACELTLDIVPCGKDWCGIEVGRDDKCGTTALKLAVAGDGDQLQGTLSLAAGTEPYVIRAHIVTGDGPDAAPRLSLTGDTGGEFRIYRRSFPFHATLARIGDAVCKDATKPVS